MKKSDKNRNTNKLIFYLPIVTILLIGFSYYFSQSYSEKWNFKWNDIRPNIKDSILKFEKTGIIISSNLSEYPKEIEQWKRENWILKNITTKELEKLTEYPNGIIKGIVYKSLLRRSENNKYELFNETLKDTSNFVFVQSGCILKEYLLSEYLSSISDIENHEVYPRDINLNFSENEKTEIKIKLKKLKMKKSDYINEYYKNLN